MIMMGEYIRQIWVKRVIGENRRDFILMVKSCHCPNSVMLAIDLYTSTLFRAVTLVFQSDTVLNLKRLQAKPKVQADVLD